MCSSCKWRQIWKNIFCCNNAEIYALRLLLSASSVCACIMSEIMVWKQTILCLLTCFLILNYFSALVRSSHVRIVNCLSCCCCTFYEIWHLKHVLKTFFILQNFLAANSQCWWNTPLTAATRSLKYAGHVAPGMLLVTAEPCALEILRGAYARSVLKPPATYTISSVGEFENILTKRFSHF